MSEIVVRIRDIKAKDIKGLSTYDFRCNYNGKPTGAEGVGNVHIWLGAGSDKYEQFIEMFGKEQTKQIVKICQQQTRYALEQLDGLILTV